MFDPSGVERIVADSVPFDRIAEHMRAGRLRALSISTTHVASGRTVVFVQRREGGVPSWGSDPTMTGRATANLSRSSSIHAAWLAMSTRTPAGASESP